MSTCGRPTSTTGKPCRNKLGSWERVCPRHATDDDRAAAQWAKDSWRHGYEVGRATGQNMERDRADSERREEARRLEVERDWRTHDERGRQIVQVGRYTYAWDQVGDLVVGDEVWLPSNWLSPDGWSGTVTQLGSSYRGELSCVSGRMHQAVST